MSLRRAPGALEDLPATKQALLDGQLSEAQGQVIVTAQEVDGSKKRRLAAPQHLALLRLDVEALWHGYVDGDERCEITGLGPIPVEVATTLLGDAVLELVITKGVDVLDVTSLTRGPTQAMQ